MWQELRKAAEVILVPLLFAIHPIAFLAAHNIHEIELTDPSRALTFAALAIPVLVALIWTLVRDGARAALVSAMAVFLFFFYGHVRELMKLSPTMAPILGRHRYLLTLFAMVFALWIWYVLTRLTSARVWVRRLAMIGVVAIIPAFLSLAASFLPGQWQTVQTGGGKRSGADAAAVQGPDVYYIILDGYGRQDVLEELYGFDNHEFLGALRARGFYVAHESQANYNTTRLSLASSLNMDYVQQVTERQGIPLTKRTAVDMIWESQVRARFEQSGYRMVAFNSGRPWSSIDDVDHYLEPGQEQAVNALLPTTEVLNDYERMLIRSTFLSFLVDSTKVLGAFERSQSEKAVEEHRLRIVYGFNQLGEIPEWSGKYFTFLHIISPHPPFIFGPSGERIEHDRDVVWGDGNNFLKVGTREEYIAGYVDQIQYINLLTLEAVDSILSKSSQPPVIIIQGDHGPGAYLNWQSIERTNILERHSILNAYYLPQGGAAELYPSISPVNTFRVVFNEYFDGEFPLLKDRAFFTEKNGRYDLVEVTDELD